MTPPTIHQYIPQIMGYDIHVTRRQNWSDKEGEDISLPEWLDLVRTDPELRLDGYAETDLTSGDLIRLEDSSMAVWLKYSKHGVDGNMAWFYHSSGNVMSKDPDEEIRQKMWQLAEQLSAKVQGDEGELYGPDGKEIVVLAPPAKPWWRVW